MTQPRDRRKWRKKETETKRFHLGCSTIAAVRQWAAHAGNKWDPKKKKNLQRVVGTYGAEMCKIDTAHFRGVIRVGRGKRLFTACCGNALDRLWCSQSLRSSFNTIIKEKKTIARDLATCQNETNHIVTQLTCPWENELTLGVILSSYSFTGSHQHKADASSWSHLRERNIASNWGVNHKCTQAWTRKTCPFLDLRFMCLVFFLLCILVLAGCIWTAEMKGLMQKTVVAEDLNCLNVARYCSKHQLRLLRCKRWEDPFNMGELHTSLLTNSGYSSLTLSVWHRKRNTNFLTLWLLLRESSARLQRKGMCYMALALRVGCRVKETFQDVHEIWLLKKMAHPSISEKKDTLSDQSESVNASEQITKGFHKQDGHRLVSTYSICTREK